MLRAGAYVQSVESGILVGNRLGEPTGGIAGKVRWTSASNPSRPRFSRSRGEEPLAVHEGVRVASPTAIFRAQEVSKRMRAKATNASRARILVCSCRAGPTFFIPHVGLGSSPSPHQRCLGQKNFDTFAHGFMCDGRIPLLVAGRADDDFHHWQLRAFGSEQRYMVLFSRVALASENVLDRQRDIARRALHLVVGQVRRRHRDEPDLSLFREATMLDAHR
jgi:hypothetical protein